MLYRKYCCVFDLSAPHGSESTRLFEATSLTRVGNKNRGVDPSFSKRKKMVVLNKVLRIGDIHVSGVLGESRRGNNRTLKG
jgi:hypothetical protein